MRKNQLQGRAELERGCLLYEEEQFKDALNAFVVAAELGDANAQVNLANMLDSGEGGVLDHSRARYWYKKAIAQGAPEAAYNLAISYQQQGNTRWFNYWIRKSAQMGDEDAMELL